MSELSTLLLHLYDVAVAVSELLVYPTSGITQHSALSMRFMPATHGVEVLSFLVPPVIFHPRAGTVHGALAAWAHGANAAMTRTSATMCMFIFIWI